MTPSQEEPEAKVHLTFSKTAVASTPGGSCGTLSFRLETPSEDARRLQVGCCSDGSEIRGVQRRMELPPWVDFIVLRFQEVLFGQSAVLILCLASSHTSLWASVPGRGRRR